MKKINKEGVQAGEEKKREIESNAEGDAKRIIEKAKKEAKKIIEDAELKAKRQPRPQRPRSGKGPGI